MTTRQIVIQRLEAIERITANLKATVETAPPAAFAAYSDELRETVVDAQNELLSWVDVLKEG